MLLNLLCVILQKRPIRLIRPIRRQPPHYQRHLHHEYRRHTVLELFVLGLVAPHLHPQPRPDTAADGRQPQKHALRDAPPVVLRLPFVDAVREKGHHRDDGQVNQDNVFFNCHNRNMVQKYVF